MIKPEQKEINRMVDIAIKGNNRYLINEALKLIEKAENRAAGEGAGRVEFESLFRFYAKYHTLIQMEIDKRYAANPHWILSYKNITLETAPWYKVMYGNQSPDNRRT